ncbi:MAG: hypothetical protein KatS3mg034_1471 [Vicingaceae bacterium]|nr:MAG: hypothetical protein KatS3mg034_1471 [Vicingaceae bacterium]
MKRVLITGAAGFIGSHLCERFLNEGFHVIAMDNLITGDLKNIEAFFPHPHFEFYFHDVTKFVHVPGIYIISCTLLLPQALSII